MVAEAEAVHGADPSPRPGEIDHERHRLVASLVLDQFDSVGAGHCARVNFLDRAEALAICAVMRDTDAPDRLDIWVLAPANGDLAITSDRAIELRNRKLRPLCLFIPPDIIDSAASSLANSFAGIDGRDLYTAARKQAETETTDPQVPAAVRQVMASLLGRLKPGERDALDLTIAGGRLGRERLGRELWRVGLIPDDSPDYLSRLTRNREVTGKLARPLRPSAGLRERIAETRVDATTARRLSATLGRHQLNDTHAWARALLADGLSFAAFGFPEQDASDLTAVAVTPFKDRHGTLTKTYAKALRQPDGPGGALFLTMRPSEKSVLVVKWTTDPLKAQNVAGWRVALVPLRDTDRADDALISSFGADSGETLDLPAKDVKGDKRDIRLTLTFEFETEPEYEIVARVVALDVTGAELLDKEGNPIAALSDPFFLKYSEANVIVPFTERRRTVASLAEGRLNAAIEANAATGEISFFEPEWRTVGAIDYFGVKTDPRTRVTVGLSSLLTGLQRRTLGAADGLGQWRLDLDELRLATDSDIVPVPVEPAGSDAWTRFTRARAAFFATIQPRSRGTGQSESANPRNVIEVAEWTAEQLAAVKRYAQAYRALLDALVDGGSGTADLQSALAVDTLTVRLAGRSDEVAVVTLPTHPLRALWLAGHHELLLSWQAQVSALAKPAARRERIDQQLVRDLRPVNVPPFTVAPGEASPFVFFRTLAFAHGVALPADVRDPLRRFLDVARIVGLDEEPITADDRAPERLGAHLDRFAEVHPYADPLQIALVNPDRGDLLAGALAQSPLFRPPTEDRDGDEAQTRRVPLLDVAAYVFDPDDLSRTDLARLRAAQGEAIPRHPTDFLYPKLATRVQPLDRLLGDDERDLAAAHLAVISDLCQIGIATAPAEPDDTGLTGSLYGLLTRFHGSRSPSDDASSIDGEQAAVRWRYRAAAPRARRLDHPADPALSNGLAEAASAVLRATATMMSPGTADREPVIEVTLTPDLVRVLEVMHQRTDWVVTIDRFFGVDYFDSPHDPVVGRFAEQHVIDYSPEFVEGLGHRMIVTTAWRAEIEAILRRAASESGLAGTGDDVRELLTMLKTVSGRLALQALTPWGASQAVGLAVALRWLQREGRFQNAVVIPVGVHQDVFAPPVKGGEPIRLRCDLLLLEFRSGFVNLTLVEVKHRRGQLDDLSDLVDGMQGQLRATRDLVVGRFFDPERIDAPLQRAVLGTISRFYVDRAERYRLMTPDAAQATRRAIGQYERSGAELRTELHQAIVVSMATAPRPDYVVEPFRLTVLTTDRVAVTPDESVTPDGAARRAGSETSNANGVDSEPSTASAKIDPVLEVIGKADPISVAMPKTDQIIKANDAHPNRELLTTDDPTTGVDVDVDVDVEPDQLLPSAIPVSGPVPVVLGDGPSGPVTWRPDVKGSPHLFITGIPGQGKSVLTRTLVRDLARQGVPSLIFDFHGEFFEDADDLFAPAGAAHRPHLADAARGLPFSPFELDEPDSAQDVRDTSQAIAEIFDYVCVLGDIQRDTLMTSIRDAYQAAAIGRGDASSRALPTMADIARRLERKEQDSRVRNVLARCRTLLEFGLFRDLPAGSPTFTDLLRDGMIVRMDNVRSDEVRTAAGAFVIRKVYRDMFGWGRADRIRLAVVLDEAHRLAKDATLPRILKEGRKYGVLVVAASQGLADFDADVLGNVGTKVSFRANNPESRKVAGFYAATPGADLVGQIERLGVGQAVIQTPEMARAAVVRVRAG